MKFNKKYLWIGIIILFIIVDIILCYFAFFRDTSVKEKEYSNSYISFTYTTDYAINVNSDTNISLGRDKYGEIDIIINELSEDVLLRDEDIIINEFNEEFEDSNDTFYVSYYGSYETDNYTIKDFLYVDQDNGKQIDINYILSGNKLVVITYINEDQYFDLYEENVLELISSIKVL